MGAMFLTAAADQATLWTVITGFMTGFLGAVVDVFEMVLTDGWLALFLVGVPLGLTIFGFATGLIKFKKK